MLTVHLIFYEDLVWLKQSTFILFYPTRVKLAHIGLISYVLLNAFHYLLFFSFWYSSSAI